MEKKTTIYTALAALMAFPSCVQEETPGGGLNEDGGHIYFRSYLPSVSETRAGVISKDNLSECTVTCFNPDDSDLFDPQTGLMTPYFSDMAFTRHADGHFLSDDAEATRWPNATSRLHFFACHPSAAALRDAIDGEGFNIVNDSRLQDGTSAFGYRLESFRVAADIADQIDFIAAYTSATQQDSGSGGIDLNFSHQLARIELSAWGASERYDFEIAGVRIGNPVTYGDFDFTSLVTPDGTPAWLNRGGTPSAVEHIFSKGEQTVWLSKNGASHSSAADAASIMGAAGPAMVIPMAVKTEAWEGKADPKIAEIPYSTDRLYFSVLLRVINREDETVYPYPNNCDNIPVIYLAVGRDGKVGDRVYLIDDEYYTVDVKDDALKYVPSAGVEVRGYSWAALPVTGGAKWEAGKIYTYKLNYTNGIGWQDPSDPTPGEPIIERGMVPFEVGVEEWVEAEGHNPDIDVPKR